MKGKNMENIREQTHKGVDNLMDKAQSTADKGQEKMTYLQNNAKRAKKDIDSYIKKNPEKSVLIATGVGLISGIIIARILINRDK